jgi:hypothetical protein
MTRLETLYRAMEAWVIRARMCRSAEDFAVCQEAISDLATQIAFGPAEW